MTWNGLKLYLTDVGGQRHDRLDFDYRSMRRFRVIPVLDLKQGAVVRGIAGRRSEYQPIVTPLSSSSEPMAVARAFRRHFGLAEIYVADLDAIAGNPPSFEVFRQLHADGFRLWIDAGIHDKKDATPIMNAGADRLIVALETVARPSVIHELCETHGSNRIVFSLDMKAGQPLGDLSQWHGKDAWSIVTEAVACGVGAVVVLDLERVGTVGGTGTDALCTRLVAAQPDLEVVAGGGVHDEQDLKRLREIGVQGVLVATALHNGRLTREAVEEAARTGR